MNEREWNTDSLLTGYSQQVLDLGTDPDGEGAIEAVLVRRDPRDGETPRGAALYVHGFSDYFFQTELADFFAARGLAFYALDLRKCGRALKPGQTAHYVSDLALYDTELNRALEIIGEEHPDQPVITAAHSTGGLILPLWLDRRRAAGMLGPVAGAALNSPWLDLQYNWLMRGPVTQLMRPLAKAAPFREIKGLPGVYGQTLHVGGTGEWEFDISLKPMDGFPVTVGWLNAVRRGHAAVHGGGVDPGVPVLVLRSDKSLFTGTYTPDCDRADLVLDTRQIAAWAGSLGGRVTVQPIPGARHDVFLSLPEVRKHAYAELADWLDHVVPA